MTARALLVLVLFLAAACGEDEPAKCGTETCGDRQTCDTEASPPTCVCQEAYTGDDCAACAYGYRPTESGGCEPVPIDCDADPLICGDHGVCTVTLMRDLKVHSCECEEGWAGHVCQRCDTGYQDNDGDGLCLPTCDMVGLSCESPLVCSDADGIARCACVPGYAGDDCTLCARGYHDPTGSGTCTPTCSTAGLDCGENRRCVDGAGEPECACLEGYAGADCTECAPGFVEGVGPGDCRPTCDVATLDCNDRGACDDSGGIPHCACDPGWAGAHCDTCAPGHRGERCELCEGGFVRQGDGPCMPTCGSGTVRCGAAQRCWDAAGGAECVCPIGYTGPACDACATGYTVDGSGYCIPMPPSGSTLIASGQWRGEQAVVAIDPTEGTVFPLRAYGGGTLAFDPAGARIFIRVSGGIARLDLTTGMTVSTISTPSFDAFTWDTMRSALLITGSTGTRRVDPTTGTYTTLSTTGPSWASDAAYDGPRDRILVSSNVTGTSLSLVSAATGASSGTLTVSAPLDTSSGIGVAVTPGGQLWEIGRRSVTGDAAAVEACRSAALGILGDDYAGASGTVVAAPAPGATVTMSSGATSGPELVVLRDYGSSTPSTVRVATTNPDAFVCIGTYGGAWRIDIASSARFRAVAAESYEQTLSVRVETGFPTPATPSVHVRVSDPTAADPSLFATPDVVRTYSSEEWYDRRIAIYGGSTTGAGALVRVDPTTGAVVSTVDLSGFVPSGGLAPYTP